jgi:hypothetical protein
MSKRKRREAGEVGAFLRQYARPASPNIDPNDRHYDREVEARLKRMDPEELDALMHGEADGGAEDHAAALIRAFVLPERQPRLVSLLRSERGRAKLRAQLAHFAGLDPRWALSLPPSDHTMTRIADRLRNEGAMGVCYLLAEDPELDGQELALEAALEVVVGRGMAAFLSCVPGRVAYFESEEPGTRFVLLRPAV